MAKLKKPDPRREREELIDDGHTIVDMNVPGTPWYREPQPKNYQQASDSDTKAIVLAAMKWAFLFALGFSAIMVLFILFCTKVWFA